MPSVYAPNIARVELRGTYYGEEVLNTLWFQRDPGVTPAPTIADLAGTIENWWRDNLRLIQAQAYTLREVFVTDWSSATAPTAQSSNQLPANGLNLDQGVPGNVALVVAFRSAGRGRSSRGRNYVPGMVEGNVAGNTFSQATVDAVVTAYEVLFDTDNIGWQHVVYSQQANGALRPSGVAVPVTQYTADLFVDSQRRRLAGRGR